MIQIEVMGDSEVPVIKININIYMKVKLLFLLFLLLFFIIRKNNTIEGNINEQIFYACSDSNPELRIYDADPPPTNYKINTSNIQKPLKGTYSYLIKDLKPNINYHRSPICKDSYNFNDNFKQQFISIIDEDDIISKNINNIKETESDYFNSHIDPLNRYRDILNFDDKLIYSQEIIDKFLNIK